MIKIKSNNVWSYIIEATDEELAQISHILSYVPKGSKYWTAKRKEIRLSIFHNKFKSFPTGLLSYLKKKGVEFEVISSPIPPQHKNNSIKLWDIKENKPLVLRDIQKKAIEAFLNQNRGICRIPPGVGKTALGIALTQHLGINTLFIVHTKDLLTKTIQNYKDILQTDDIGIIGDGVWEPKKITVAIIKTLARRIDEEYVQAFLKSIEFVIFDEIQHSSKDYQKVSHKMPNAFFRLGLSATALMGDKQSKLETMSLCGPIIYEEKLHKLVKKGILAQPTAIFIDIEKEGRVKYCPDAVSENSIFRGRWDRQARYKLGETVYHYASYYTCKKEVPIAQTIMFEPGTPGSYEVWETDWQAVLQGGTIDNGGRNLILSHAILELVDKKLSTLVLIEKLQHGINIAEILEELSPTTLLRYVSGQDKSEIREEALWDLERRKLDVLIASRIFNEGVDLPNLDAVVVASGFKAAGLTVQRYGRGLRTTDTKKHLVVVDTYDRFHPIMQKHSEERMKLCKKSKAFVVKVCKWEEFKEVLEETLKERREG